MAFRPRQLDFRVTLRPMDFFFDRPKVIAAVGKARAKRLSKFGAFVRTSARSSIRRRKKVSQPGQPPSAHSKDKVRSIKNIQFSYDRSSDGVVVGPIKLNGMRGQVPQALEHGGPILILSGRRGAKDVRTVTIQARPFMLPALKKEAPKFPGVFANLFAG
jgi:hypothetical protein